MIFPVRMRGRLTIAFILVAAVSAVMLATGSYLLGGHHRVRAKVDQALDFSRFNVAMGPRQFDPAQIDSTVTYYHRWAGADVLVLQPGVVHASRTTLVPSAVPAALRRSVEAGQVGHRWTKIRYLVAAASVDSDTQVHFFFSGKSLFSGLLLLRNVLVTGCAVLTLLAALVGYAIARRTLGPVRVAADGARPLAEGLLDTRLTVGTDDEFGAWARYFNEMADALEEKIKVLEEARNRERQFTADVAHELLTPLSAVVGATSLLAEHMSELPPDLRRPAELTISGVSRLRRVTEELLDLSRLDARSEPLVLERVDVADAVSTMVIANGWEAAVDTDCERMLLYTDARSFDRIVGNLVDNAVRHGGAGVRVRVGQDGDDAVVEVSDQGPGIPPEHLPAIFNRFHKVDSSRAATGSGLGLAIAKKNAERIGAGLDVESEVGVGTRFVLRLPCVGEHHRHEPPPERDGPTITSPAPQRAASAGIS